MFYQLESCVCENEPRVHVLVVSCGLIVGRVESLRGLRWIKWMLSFHKLSLFGKSRTAIHRHVKTRINMKLSVSLLKNYRVHTHTPSIGKVTDQILS